MSTWSNLDPIWITVDRPDLNSCLQVIYDPSVTGYRSAKTSDQIITVPFSGYQANFGSNNNISNISGSVYQVDNTAGFAGIAFQMFVPTGGEITFQGTFDGINYSNVTMRRIANDGYIQTTTGIDSYLGSIAGLRSFRVLVSQSGIGSGTIMGTLQRTQHTLEGIENGPPNDFPTNLAENKVAGYSLINKFGRNSGIHIASTPTDIWNAGGIYQGFPTGIAETVKISSSSPSDHLTGVGARSINVIGLDTNFLAQTESFNLSGINFVTGVKNWKRINSATITSVGSSDFNLGTISGIYSNTTGVRFFAMPVGTNQTFVGAYTVPANKTAYLKQIYASLNRGPGTGIVQDRDADICLAVRSYSGVFRLRRPTSLSSNSALDYQIYGGLSFSEKTDIVIRCTSVSLDNNDISAGFDMVLVDN